MLSFMSSSLSDMMDGEVDNGAMDMNDSDGGDVAMVVMVKA